MVETILQERPSPRSDGTDGAVAHRLLAADIIIANAPDPVFVSDLEGKILQANDAVSQLLGFRQDEVLEQSLSRFITPDDMRELDKARAYAESLIKNAPDPVFVSDLEGKILQANDAVFALLGFRPDELIEQSLSRFISPEETREFTAALREVVERGVTRNARLNPRSASGEVIPTTLNASALRD